MISAITELHQHFQSFGSDRRGLLAKKAGEKGLKRKPWVKTSLAPGSRVVTEYLKDSGLLPHLENLGFHIVGYGCTTCIGNSGPLPEAVSNGYSRRRSSGRGRVVRQPQLRRPHSRQRARELFGFAAAGGRLCARRQHGCRSLQ